MSACAVSVANDFRGLKQATIELMEEARRAPQQEGLERMARGAANADDVLAGCHESRSLAEGFYLRVEYLLELESFFRAGVQGQLDLDLAEARGILAIASARAEFDRLHPPCRSCGVRLENSWDTMCGDCQRESAAAKRKH